MTRDPREIINNTPMSPLQIAAVAITVGLNALDGFDVLSISFAAPGIATEWGVDKAALGVVLSMELIGMAVGSVFLGRLADKIGRRPTILGCLTVMAFGMYMVTTVSGIAMLSFWRVLTGLGIGGMLAAINAVAAEFSSLKRRHFAMSMMVIGYPLGAVIGGIVTAQLLTTHDWRAVFEFGATVSACFIPLVWFLIPETPTYLADKQPRGALEAINRTLIRLKHEPIEGLPERTHEERRRSIADIFKPALLPTTLIVTFAYLAHMVSFYFILKWTPKIVVDMGFAPSAAAGVLVWANAGGVVGGAIFGMITSRFGLKPLTIGSMVMSFVTIAAFGQTSANLTMLSAMVCVIGMFTNGAVAGLYTIFAQAYPTGVRATGTGFAIGMGRGGAVLAPMIAGVLFQWGLGLPMTAAIMAVGTLCGAAGLMFLKLSPPAAVTLKAGA